MATTAEEKAALAVGLTAVADATGVRGMFYRAAANTSNVILALPGGSTTDPHQPMRGRWLNIYSKSANLQYAFSKGTTGAVLTYNATVNVPASTGSQTTAGATVPSGSVWPILIPSDANFVSIISEAATDFVELYVSEGPG